VTFHFVWDEVNYDTVIVDDALTLITTGANEEDAITSAFANPGYNFNLFIVSQVKDTDGEILAGFASGSYAFMTCCGSNSLWTAAHELAHALGNLEDIEDLWEDYENLMSYTGAGTRLRKGQWDDCNP
jgi:hypothetical protein